ncbi:MAG: TIGR02757 family protein [Flavobacteriales bacterium]|nr:TIGR02757 family protein [Flavobacteriales bacterium]
MKLSILELKEFLDEKVIQYNNSKFIESDPISIPHRFSKKQDIEIAGFLSATIAWGNRKSIINNANKLMNWMDNDPHNFVVNATDKELAVFEKFVHRTFNGDDCQFFIYALQQIYKKNKSLEDVFAPQAVSQKTDTSSFISNFRNTFFSYPHLQRTEKHISNPLKNSSAKRLNMMLRWFCRHDKNGVDFGIWSKIKPSQLVCPLDVHTGNVGRKLGLLQRKQNDWKAAIELTNNLKLVDPNDPVKYDFALFGLGVFEKF